jgi:hypothetical protein
MQPHWPRRRHEGMHLRRASLTAILTAVLWFDPGTGAEQWLIRAPANQVGVTVAIPFYSREDGNL